MRCGIIASARRRNSGNPNAAAFSPDFKHPNIALSNSNRTITKNAADAFSVIGATEAKATGLWYFEVTVDALITGELSIGCGDYTVGIANYIGVGSTSMGYNCDGRVITSATTQSGSPGTYTTGDIISVAVDATNRRVHFRKNGGSWANSGNPAGNSGGYVLAGTQPLMPMIQLYASGTIVSANFGAAAFAFSPPSGFSAWTKTARTGHRYWRFFHVSGNNSQASIAEIAMRLTSGGSNQIGSGTPSSSSVFDGTGTYAASKAVDGNASTWWNAANAAGPGSWWQYDFGSGNDKDITEMVMTVISAALQYPTEFHFAYSDDGSLFYPLLGYAGLTWTTGETKTFTLTP